MKQLNLTGRTFGKWLVIHKVKDVQKDSYKEAIWLCRCTCGTERELGSRILLHKTSNSRSCGCNRSETQRLHPSRLTHGYSKTHVLYPTWKTMRQRCMNPNNAKYHRYGGRGIKICKRWNKFENFIEDMSSTWRKGLSIDRKDNDGNYEPNNCKWSTPKEQANNRGSKNLLILESNNLTEDELINWESIPEISTSIKQLFNNNANDIANVEFYQMLDSKNALFSYMDKGVKL